MNIVDSPINWLGGKSQSAQKIVNLLPEHDCYCEVFAGGLWAFFKKKPSKIEIVNDINSELINLYRTLQTQCDKFKEREKYELYSSELYYEYLADFYSGKHATLSNLEKAFRFFCLIKMAFASKFGAGFGFGAVRNNASAFFNEFKILDEVTKRLKNAIIDNRDFESVIKSYDGERTIIFCDPPYMDANNKDYYFKSSNNSFGINDHQRLFLKLKSLKGKCILTVDDTQWIRERYTKENGFFLIENKVFYCSADGDNRRHVIELIITNYDPKEEKKYMDSKQGTLDF